MTSTKHKKGNAYIKGFSDKWRGIFQEKYDNILSDTMNEADYQNKRQKITHDFDVVDNYEADDDTSTWTGEQKLELCKRQAIAKMTRDMYLKEDAEQLFSDFFGRVSDHDEFEQRWEQKDTYGQTYMETA
jgi:hypothetical protein